MKSARKSAREGNTGGTSSRISDREFLEHYPQDSNMHQKFRQSLKPLANPHRNKFSHSNDLDSLPKMQKNISFKESPEISFTLNQDKI